MYIILIFVVFMAGCTDTPQKTLPVKTPVNGMIVFNESDNGDAYAINRNTEFFVNLTESYATGTKWHARLSGGLELLDDDYRADPKSVRVDIGGTRTWRLRATGTGQQSFQADFYQFSDADKVQESYSLSLQVLPDSG